MDSNIANFDVSTYYNPKCKEALEKCKILDIDEKHIFLQHDNELTLANAFALDYAQIRHSKLEKKSSLRRPFEYCYLSLKYPFGEGVTERDFKKFFDSARLKTDNKYNRFLGTYMVDISDYLKTPFHPAIDRLVDYIESTSQSVKYILAVDTYDMQDAEKMYTVLNKRIRRLEHVFVGHLDTHQYVDYAVSLLRQKGIGLEEGIERLLAEYVEKTSAKKIFAGFESVSDCVDEIIYKIHGSDDSNLLTITRLAKIIDTDYVNADYSFMDRKIGFR